MRKFVSSSDVAPIQRVAEHGGSGPIAFRRLIDSGEFDTKVDFLDLTIIPPRAARSAGTSIATTRSSTSSSTAIRSSARRRRRRTSSSAGPTSPSLPAQAVRTN